METPEEAPSGLPAQEGEEAQPLGPDTTDPDGEAPPQDELPGLPEPGEEPSTGG